MTTIPPQWRAWRSDKGRHWATRTIPFPPEVERYAVVDRTVSADDETALAEAIRRQEDRARDLLDNPPNWSAE